MDCIDLFKRAAVALQTDPRYLALDQARKANDNDENLQNLIGADIVKVTHYSRIYDADHSNDELFSIAYDAARTAHWSLRPPCVPRRDALLRYRL